MNHIILNNQPITPSKIICIGRNYVDHIKELANEIPDEMVVFNKPNSAITSELVSFHHEPLHYEAEICFIHQQGKLTGIGLGLDLTKRELQAKLKAKGLPWERAKAFDGSAIFSEFIPFDGNFEGLKLTCSINGALRQAGGVEHMIYPPQNMQKELSTFMTLTDGDVLMTGTPKGVGQINQGDIFECHLYRHDTLLLSVQWQAQ
ncbi:fumarylacetoacetate hydrolase family protein [Thalassotalea fusca]